VKELRPLLSGKKEKNIRDLQELSNPYKCRGEKRRGLGSGVWKEKISDGSLGTVGGTNLIDKNSCTSIVD